MKFTRKSLIMSIFVIASVVFMICSLSEVGLPSKTELENDYTYIENIEITKVHKHRARRGTRTDIYACFEFDNQTVEVLLGVLPGSNNDYTEGDIISGWVNKSDNTDVYTEIAESETNGNKFGSVFCVIVSVVLFALTLTHGEKTKKGNGHFNAI